MLRSILQNDKLVVSETTFRAGPVSPGRNRAHKTPLDLTGHDYLDWRLHDCLCNFGQNNDVTVINVQLNTKDINI